MRLYLLTTLVIMFAPVGLLTGQQSVGQGLTGNETSAQAEESCTWYCVQVMHEMTGEPVGMMCFNDGYFQAWGEQGYSCLAINMACFTYQGPFCDGMAHAQQGADGVFLALVDGCTRGERASVVINESGGHSHADHLIYETGILEANWRVEE